MKIQSRKETGSKPGRYKTHKNTALKYDPGITAIGMAESYIPTSSCPSDSQPRHWLVFGMDDRRVFIELNHAELTSLKNDIDRELSRMGLRRVK